MIPLSRIQRSSDFDFSDWYGRPIAWAKFARALSQEFDCSPPEIEMPVSTAFTGTDGRGGPAVDDPLTIYLTLPPLAPEGRPVLYTCSVKHLIWGLMQEERIYKGEEGSGGATMAVFAALLELMEQLKGHILEHDPNAFAER